MEVFVSLNGKEKQQVWSKLKGDGRIDKTNAGKVIENIRKLL